MNSRQRRKAAAKIHNDALAADEKAEGHAAVKRTHLRGHKLHPATIALLARGIGW